MSIRLLCTLFCIGAVVASAPTLADNDKPHHTVHHKVIHHTPVRRHHKSTVDSYLNHSSKNVNHWMKGTSKKINHTANQSSKNINHTLSGH